MLSGQALDLAFALREKVGVLSQGEGPSLDELRKGSAISHSEFDRALAELESIGFVGIDRTAPAQAVVVVLAPLQIYLDDLESQGGDDF
jgi:hypothetical protein